MFSIFIFAIGFTSFALFWIPLPVPLWTAPALALSALSLNIPRETAKTNARRVRLAGNILAILTCILTAAFYLFVLFGTRLL
ncbi:hypothetical protein KKF34_08735 [Myxococcota bacterium]|nr:hypothetical protein [Myxococcota bacterium]MBU1380138.1 hypothetical protein [Myxococcota bacterium]MBU1496950.1 hypothetical protein [Myxococcota bacterium]